MITHIDWQELTADTPQPNGNHVLLADESRAEVFWRVNEWLWTASGRGVYEWTDLFHDYSHYAAFDLPPVTP